MLDQQSYKFSTKARVAMGDYIRARRMQPHFANARSIRNALDRTRLRHANRLLETGDGVVTTDMLSTLDESDVRNSRVFTQGGTVGKA